MGKRRRGAAESLLSAPQEKKEKVPEFTGTEFKAALKEPAAAMKGLETFVSTAKRLPSPDVYDVVEGYLKISMECSEIFRLLEGQKPTETETLLVFESLELILLRTAGDLSHFGSVGGAIVQKLLGGHMKVLQGSFRSENHRFVRQCLCLLSALVSQGPEAAREVLSQLHVSKVLSGLARRRDKKGRPDVRTAFVQFVLSFLVSGDNATVGQVLELKELLPEILSSGLREDRMSLVNLILSTLKTRVLLNKGVSKTQKVRFFTPAVLSNLASLYRWNGIADAADDGMAEDGEDGGASVVRGLVHGFLLDVCCSRKHGISFHDPSFGTAGRGGNIVLLQFLVGLKQATEDELVADLVVNVLRTCPDVLARFFKETQYSYTPRLKSAWRDNVGFLMKIYRAQPDLSAIFQTGEVVPLPRLLAMILVTSLPPVCTKVFFTQGLSLANAAVQLTTLSTMSFVLKRAEQNVRYLLDPSARGGSDLYSGEAMEELVQRYRETLSKVLPDMTSVVALWQSLSKREKDGEDAGRAGETDSAQVVALKALVLRVTGQYQSVTPHLVAQCRFDFTKLFRGIVSDAGRDVPPVLQHHVLQLALDLPASKFSWFRLQDASDSDPSEKSVLYLLLQMFVGSGAGRLRTCTRRLVLKVLRDSGAFEYTWSELWLWLDRLVRVDPDQRDVVVQFLERVLAKLACGSHAYADKVAGAVQEAAHLQANAGHQDADGASVPVSHIDDVLDMLDVIMEGNDGDMEEFGPVLSEDLIGQTFPFSALVPAVLEARNKLPADRGAVHRYVCAVLCDVLHCQRDPLPLCLVLMQYDSELAASGPPDPPHPAVAHLQQYYSRWLPQQSRPEPFSSPALDPKTFPAAGSYGALMRAAYVREAGAPPDPALDQEAEEALGAMSVSEFPVAIAQVLLYVRTTVETFGTFPRDAGTDLLKNLMGRLGDLLTGLQNFQEPENPEPVEENLPEGSDLFLDQNQSSTEETSKEQILVSALGSVLKHPCLEQWFLALDRSAPPPHALNPVTLKRLCAQMSDHVLVLLQTCAPVLRDLDRLDLLHGYAGAVEGAALKELAERTGRPAPETRSRALRALLSLHAYMDPCAVRRVVSGLLLLPQESLVRPGGPAELSVYGHAALQILTERKSDRDRGAFLTPAHLGGLAALLLSCSSPALESFLLGVLSDEPGGAGLIPTDVLLHCLRNRPSDSRDLCALLLQNSSAHRLRFELWCLEPGRAEQLSEQTVLIPLIGSYLQVASADDPARPGDVQADVLKVLKRAFLPKLTRSVLENLTEESGARLAETLSHLIQLSADAEDVRDLIRALPAALQEADGFERWRLVDVVEEKLVDAPEELETWRRSVAGAALRFLAASFGRSRDPASCPAQQEQSILGRLRGLVTSAPDVAAPDWNGFVRSGLKYRFRDRHFLNALTDLLDPMYAGAEARTDLVPLATLHAMTSSHSLFLPTMLDSDEEPGRRRAKEALVSLLLRLVKMCPAVCDPAHFVVVLGAYGATLGSADQNLLLLLQEYERNRVSLLKFQSLLWGPVALEHHRTRKSLGASLWRQTSTDELLVLLKPDRMLRTVARFPQRRTLVPQEGEEPLHGDQEEAEDPGDLYDPRFLLPLFSAILRPESVVDCLKFVSRHALGLAVAALSSYDPKMRAAAYHVLSCFCQHLEGARFKEKRQLLYLMDMVKNGVRQQNQRFPFVLSTYVSRVAQQMLKPEDHMYVVLNRFLLSHQSLDLRRVPEFFKLFYGFDLEHKTEREWILSVLLDGLSDGGAFELCDRQRVFQNLLSFGSSPLCDEHAQAQIVRVLCRVARVPRAAHALTKSCGLLTWTLQMLQRRNRDQDLLSSVTDLVHALWFTNLGRREERADGSERSSSPPGRPGCLPLPLVDDFLCVTSAVVGRLRPGVKAAQLGRLLRTLRSLLRHRAAALAANRRAGRLVLPPRPLPCGDALALLLCWASLTRDAALCSQIHVLREKHRATELPGTGREKTRGKGSVSRAGSQRERPTEEAEPADGGAALLAACKTDLSGILFHWEPAPPLSDQLAADAAHLFARWTLRCLVEDGYDEDRTEDFLRWLERAVMKRGEVVDAVLLDPGVRADLLRLYHDVSEAARRRRGSAGGPETFRLFTDILLKLLETRVRLPERHHALVSVCLPDADQDPARREAGLGLLSLYVHELWSGAESAELFLSHVRLVTRARRERQEASGPASEPAVRTVCNDIMALMS